MRSKWGFEDERHIGIYYFRVKTRRIITLAPE